MKNLLIFLSFLTLVTACEKPPLEPDAPPYFEKVWEHRFVENGHKLHAAPIISEDLLIIWPNSFIDLPYDFAFVDKVTGEKTFEFQHPDRISDVIGVRLYDDLLIVVAKESIYCFDLKTKSIMWDIPSNPDSVERIYTGLLFEDYFYIAVSTSSTQSVHNRDILQQKRFNVYTGEMELLYEHQSDKFDWDIATGGSTIYRDKKGTLQGVFGLSYWTDTIAPSGTLSDLVSVNLETKEVNWINIDYSENGAGTGIYMDDKLYINTDWSLYCFDATNGNRLWRREVVEPQPYSIFKTKPVYANNHFYCLDGLGTMYKINATSSHVVKTFYEVVPGNDASPLVNDGKIFYSSFGTQRIHIFDIDKDEFVHHEPYTSFGEAIVYDAEVDLYYTVTDTHLHAFRIND